MEPFVDGQTDGFTAERPPYRWAFATFAVIFALYYVTLAPTIAFWDTAEYIAAAKVLGIPHPPGNPLFTLLGHVWGLLPLASDYAVKINLFAAFTSAAGAGFWFLIAERWLRAILPTRLPRLGATFAGVFASATAWTVWSQSTVNEKVYTLSLLTIAIVVWCAVYWADQPAGERRDRWLVLGVYLSLLSTTNHQMGILGLPVLLWYVVSTDWQVVLRWRVVSLALFLAVLGVTLHYIYLPMRAAQFPPINEGEPAGFFSQALKDNLNRAQYAKPKLFPRQPWWEGMPVENGKKLMAQLTNYWQYWTWQWGRDLGNFRGLAVGLFTALGLGGVIALVRARRREGLAALGLLLTLTIALTFYLNFKYGYSYQPSNPAITQEMREVRERDYFFIGSFAYVGVLFAAGFAVLLRAIATRGDTGVLDEKRAIAAMPILLLGLVPLIGNRVTAPRWGETLPRDFAIDILESVEPYGILITAGDNDTFPLWFAQEVLGVRRDVTLANLSLMNTDWHLRQIRRRPQEAFDPERSHPFWRPGTDSVNQRLGLPPQGNWQMPDTPALMASEQALTAIREFERTPANPILDIPSGDGTAIRIHFGRPWVERADVAAAHLINDNMGKRPIYFSWSASTYPDDVLGLGPYLLSQGLVRKLMPDTVRIGGNIAELQPGSGVDLERTRALLFDVYHAESAAKDRPRGWVDPPSATILHLYALTYLTGAQLFSENGANDLANRAGDIGQRIARSLEFRE